MSEYDDQYVAAIQDIYTGEIRRCENRSEGASSKYVVVIPICSQHYKKARTQFAARIEAELEELKQTAAGHECDGERAVAAHIHETFEYHELNHKRRLARSQAYFIRCGKYIKIGASASPLNRLHTIRTIGGVLAPHGLDLSTAELLATEDGGFDREKALHKRFHHLRDAGEWFLAEPELLAYIQERINNMEPTK